ncbi:serine/threonine protein phosphatase 2A 57 kDa regulatory subunit B' beta isoform-like [Cornus florida]|uniref:serine/threonine protein phosphatase 2A 57 kDa regulatory subunit B' beta isoform-like n=1 Tax=Cornus florida TaxID=4283 RepID=UPI00289F1807|nr:serine/threonine protein phosphatase 2A 57 kDa regulatory subunit B' beta isoform-like [Cornus florida]
MGAQRNSPKPSPKNKSTTLQHLFDLDSKKNNCSNLSGRDSISRGSLFETENEEVLSVIPFCSFTYTFTDPLESPSEQDLKRQKLLQLLSIIKSPKTQLQDQVFQPLFSMISTNLFRPLPPPCNKSGTCFLPDDEDLATTPTMAWPHLQIVYDVLLRLVISMEAKALRDYIDQPFLVNLLSLFQSEDPRERESLKNVYHRIYSKFTFYRSFMRKAMNDVFLHYIFETDPHFGIAELLEIWGSIINGFTVPLKEEHKLFLMRVLVPLHKPKGIQAYHRQLAYCVSQFVQKEPLLGGVVVRGILRYWPVTNCQKEVLLIGELEELVENIDPEQYRKLAPLICTQITKCFNSCNSQVAERALYVWNNEQFIKMVSQSTEEVFPVIVAGVEKNLKIHWSQSVQQLTENVKVMLEETEPGLYSKCLQEIERQEFAAGQEEMKRKEKWERIEIVAAARSQFLQQPPHCIKCS